LLYASSHAREPHANRHNVAVARNRTSDLKRKNLLAIALPVVVFADAMPPSNYVITTAPSNVREFVWKSLEKSTPRKIGPLFSVSAKIRHRASHFIDVIAGTFWRGPNEGNERGELDDAPLE